MRKLSKKQKQRLEEIGYGKIYWAYNLPIQFYSEQNGIKINGYSPRKLRCYEGDLEKITEKDLELIKFCTIKTMKNFIRLVKKMEIKEDSCVYYPDEGLDLF